MSAKESKWFDKGPLFLGILFFFVALYQWGEGRVVLPLFLLCLSLGFLGVFIHHHWSRVVFYFFSRRGKSGVRGTVYLCTLLGTLLLFYGLFYFELFRVRWDISENAIFTLSPETKSFLQRLREPFLIRVFSPRDSKDLTQRILNEYADASKWIRVEYVDPFQNPQLAQSYDVKERGAILVEKEGKKPLLIKTEDMVSDSNDGEGESRRFLFFEERVTHAMISLSMESKKQVVFYVGHGARNYSSLGGNGLSEVARNLVLRGVDVGESALDKDLDPKMVNAVVIAGVKEDLSPLEVKVLKHYVDGGGNLVLLEDPSIEIGKKTQNLDGLLMDYGVRFDEDLIFDKNHYLTGLGGKKGAPFIPEVYMQENAALAPLKSGEFSVYFFTARSIMVNRGSDRYKVEDLLKTSSEAYGEVDFQNLSASGYDPGRDVKGPMSVMVALEGKTNQRLVFGGDSGFASNYMVSEIRANKDLFVNMVLWSLGESDFPSSEKRIEYNSLSLSQNTQMISFLIFVVFLPLALFVLGFFVYYSRMRGKKGGEN